MRLCCQRPSFLQALKRFCEVTKRSDPKILGTEAEQAGLANASGVGKLIADVRLNGLPQLWKLLKDSFQASLIEGSHLFVGQLTEDLDWKALLDCSENAGKLFECLDPVAQTLQLAEEMPSLILAYDRHDLLRHVCLVMRLLGTTHLHRDTTVPNVQVEGFSRINAAVGLLMRSYAKVQWLLIKKTENIVAGFVAMFVQSALPSHCVENMQQASAGKHLVELGEALGFSFTVRCLPSLPCQRPSSRWWWPG